ncbi:MAG TPA: hypothetical protein EYQ24_07015 [Bacteroidetes bacterium]|nr:hypothetical protein [Bacteroidota bacterium]HIL57863.1 hypothetical protein [Rhodothermales bacterium]
MLRLSLALVALSVSPALAQDVPGWARPVSPDDVSRTPPSEVSRQPVGPGLPGGPGGPGGGTGPGSQASQRVPLDGGLGLLALAGGAYAVRRLRNRDEADA